MIEQKTVGIISFDLGSPYGWAYSHFVGNKQFTVKDGGTIDLNNMAKDRMYDNIINHTRKRLIIFEQQLHQMFTSFSPISAVVAEDTFLDPRKPQVYRSILLYLETLERVTFCTLNMPIYRIPARHIKMVITGNGNADKAEVQTAIQNHPDIGFKKTSILKGMTSHLSDAVGIGYCFARSLSNTY